jgi:serine/threonine-protein kinase
MLQIGDIVGKKYKILSEIGRGGMSIVYLAIDEKINKTWAIKLAERKGLSDNNFSIQNLTADKDVLIKFNHPYLPRIVDVYDTEDSMMLVMDYIEGQSLGKILNEFGAQAEEDVIKWGIQLCDVLSYVHNEGMIYRDLKPDNIMLKPNGDISLIDFGTAKRFDEEKSKDTVALGTKGYAAPEQSVKATVSSDIYNLGATLRHLVTGIDPQNPQTLNITLNPIREINSSLSEGIEYIISKCLAPSPNDRYKTAKEAMFDLENYKAIGKSFRKKQKRKLHLFFMPIFFTLVFAGISAYSYSESQRLVGENYDLKVSSAEDITKTETQRKDLLIEAMNIDASNETAYLNLIDLFLSSEEENGSLSREEGSILIKLNAGIDVDNVNSTSTIYPLKELERADKDVYEEICYQIGIAFWYDYEVDTDRYTNAVEWFNKSVDKYPISQTYVDIGDCQKDIKKYKGQSRTEEMYTAYELLWNKLTDLLSNAASISDNDTKMLIWNEIVTNTNQYAADFNVKISKENMLSVLQTIKNNANNLKNETSYEVTKENIDILLVKIQDTETKINSFAK